MALFGYASSPITLPDVKVRLDMSSSAMHEHAASEVLGAVRSAERVAARARGLFWSATFQPAWLAAWARSSWAGSGHQAFVIVLSDHCVKAWPGCTLLVKTEGEACIPLQDTDIMSYHMITHTRSAHILHKQARR